MSPTVKVLSTTVSKDCDEKIFATSYLSSAVPVSYAGCQKMVCIWKFVTSVYDERERCPMCGTVRSSTGVLNVLYSFYKFRETVLH